MIWKSEFNDMTCYYNYIKVLNVLTLLSIITVYGDAVDGMSTAQVHHPPGMSYIHIIKGNCTVTIHIVIIYDTIQCKVSSVAFIGIKLGGILPFCYIHCQEDNMIIPRLIILLVCWIVFRVYLIYTSTVPWSSWTHKDRSYVNENRSSLV